MVTESVGPVVDDTLTAPVAVLTASVVAFLVMMDFADGDLVDVFEMFDMVDVPTDLFVATSLGVTGFSEAVVAEMFQTVDDLD